MQALFADAPVDSDMFMSYLHQNYPPFCDDAENLDDLLSYLSDADALMRMEGDAVRIFSACNPAC
jgi:cell cycle checkpoint protein